jgi:hypothetical protein
MPSCSSPVLFANTPVTHIITQPTKMEAIVQVRPDKSCRVIEIHLLNNRGQTALLPAALLPSRAQLSETVWKTESNGYMLQYHNKTLVWSGPNSDPILFHLERKNAMMYLIHLITIPEWYADGQLGPYRSSWPINLMITHREC